MTTTTAAWQKLFSPAPHIGFLSHARDLSAKLAGGILPADQTAKAPQLIFNDYLDAGLTALFLAVSWILVLDMLRVCRAILNR